MGAPMRTAFTFGCLTAGLVALAACETAPSASADVGSAADQQCFHVRAISGYEAVDRDTLRVDTGVARYDLDLSGSECDGIERTHRLAIESTPSAWICVDDAPGQGVITFRVPETRSLVECRIDDVRPAGEPGSH